MEHHLDHERTHKTVVAGAVGGAVGMALLGPVGLVAGGVGTALYVKDRIKKRDEKFLRDDEELEGGGGARE